MNPQKVMQALTSISFQPKVYVFRNGEIERTKSSKAGCLSKLPRYLILWRNLAEFHRRDFVPQSLPYFL